MKAFNCTSIDIDIPHIVSGDGCFVIDAQGNRYADFESGVWCAALGHNRKEINRAITAQLDGIAHTGYRYSCHVVEQAAQSLLDALGMPEGQCVFLSSGSEAVELAVKEAREILPASKPYALCLEGHFLSSYGQTAARPSSGWVSLPSPADHPSAWESTLAGIPWEKVGVFVLEPGNASGTVRLPPKGFIDAIAARIQENGGLVVVDEVTTGIGRTGKWFGFQHYGLSPDLVACGKGLGNGYPVSAVAMKPDVARQLAERNFYYAQSHQNDPLGCAVAQAVIDCIRNGDLIHQAAKTGAYFLGQLQDLSRRLPGIREVRGVGLMLAVELPPDIPAAKIHRNLLEKGFITGVKPACNTLRFYPPLIVERSTVNGLVAALEGALASPAKNS